MAEDDIDTRAIREHGIDDGVSRRYRALDGLGQPQDEVIELLMRVELDTGAHSLENLVLEENGPESRAADIFNVLVDDERLEDTHAHFVPKDAVFDSNELGFGHFYPRCGRAPEDAFLGSLNGFWFFDDLADLLQGPGLRAPLLLLIFPPSSIYPLL